MDYTMHGMSCGWSWIFMGFWWVFLIAVVVFGVQLARKKNGMLQSKTPLDIIKERYARGEISKQEFEDMKKDIS